MIVVVVVVSVFIFLLLLLLPRLRLGLSAARRQPGRGRLFSAALGHGHQLGPRVAEKVRRLAACQRAAKGDQVSRAIELGGGNG